MILKTCIIEVKVLSASYHNGTQLSYSDNLGHVLIADIMGAVRDMNRATNREWLLNTLIHASQLLINGA